MTNGPVANQPAKSGWAGKIGGLGAIVAAATALLVGIDALVNKSESLACKIISSTASWCQPANRLSFSEAKFFYKSGRRSPSYPLREYLKQHCDGRVYCDIDLGNQTLSRISGQPFMGITFMYACGAASPISDYEWAGIIKRVSCTQDKQQ